ncbi:MULTISPECIES: site-specific integrase [unclassified Modicisalibacter]|uniref:tyrosine-type recombinase/integrase n=1 Tax=unclassified Modicisalibacter TaxID=2679913 RepID=UPI001CCBEC21|nr:MULTISPECIES: site-specific integrase [unclassified Modicisalibacter]MBZ9559117.1 site-specific integrase [Modicisalibacter sp. R2A 31.J]MBZ9576772.1 site-specific integrase [Modicisalibacter sp. MOD 31.J]
MNDVSFLELVSRYSADRHLRPKSVSTYTGVVRLFRRYLEADAYPSMVTRDMVVTWRESIVRSASNPEGIAESSWNNYARHLKALYRFGIKYQLIAITSNPFEEVSLKLPRKPKKTLTTSQVKTAREALKICRRYESDYNEPSVMHPAWFWQVVMETFYYTGIRLNQLLCIKVAEINLRERVFVASAEGSKNNNEMSLPIPAPLYPYMSELLVAAHHAGFRKGDQLYNVNRFSERHRRSEMDTWQVEGFFKKLSQYSGGKITPHRFRHTLATEMMQNPEKNIHMARDILNHKDLRSTLEYVHPDVEAMRDFLDQRRSADM